MLKYHKTVYIYTVNMSGLRNKNTCERKHPKIQISLARSDGHQLKS